MSFRADSFDREVPGKNIHFQVNLSFIAVSKVSLKYVTVRIFENADYNIAAIEFQKMVVITLHNVFVGTCTTDLPKHCYLSGIGLPAAHVRCQDLFRHIVGEFVPRCRGQHHKIGVFPFRKAAHGMVQEAGVGSRHRMPVCSSE